MTYDMTQTLISLGGQPLVGPATVDENGNECPGKPIPLREVCINALMAMLESDKGQSGEDKLANYVLSSRLLSEDEPDLLPEDVAKIKKRIGEMYSASVVGPAFTVLNGTAATQ